MTSAFEITKDVPPLASAALPAASCTEPLAASDLAHLVIEGLFALVFPDPHARLRLGLKGISRARHEEMAWYLWTTPRVGAFELALLPGRPETRSDGALLALRYFPDPREAVFERFTPVEQRTRLSPLFDSSGTPAADTADQIDPSLFHIATLILAPQGDNRIALQLATQDQWIEVVRTGDDWSTRRSAPGLRLALAVFDALACGLSYLGRRPPLRVRVWKRPGLVWRIEADGQACSECDAGITAWEIELEGLLLPGGTGTEEQPSFGANANHPPFFEHASEVPPRHLPWPVNSQWWQAAGWQFDPVGEFCAQCAGETHAHEHPPTLSSE